MSNRFDSWSEIRFYVALAGICTLFGSVGYFLFMLGYHDNHKHQWSLREAKQQEIEAIFCHESYYSILLRKDKELVQEIFAKNDVQIFVTVPHNEQPYAIIKVYDHPWNNSWGRDETYSKMELHIRSAEDVPGLLRSKQ